MNTAAPTQVLTRSLGGVEALMVTPPGLLATGAIIVLAVDYYRLALHGRGRWAHRSSGE